MPPVVTMAIGDSITMGSSTYRGGYRRPLNNLAPNLVFVGRNCRDATYGDTVGHHEGYSGAQTTTFKAGGTAGDIVTQVDAYGVALALIMLGTNDLSGGKTVAQLLLDVVERATAIKARSTVKAVIVGNIAPRASNEAKYAETVSVRAGMQAAVEAAGAGIYYCDPCADLVNPGAHFTDSLHPSEVGYALMAPRWYAAIRAAGVQTRLGGLGMR